MTVGPEGYGAFQKVAAATGSPLITSPVETRRPVGIPS